MYARQIYVCNVKVWNVNVWLFCPSVWAFANLKHAGIHCDSPLKEQHTKAEKFDTKYTPENQHVSPLKGTILKRKGEDRLPVPSFLPGAFAVSFRGSIHKWLFRNHGFWKVGSFFARFVTSFLTQTNFFEFHHSKALAVVVYHCITAIILKTLKKQNNKKHHHKTTYQDMKTSNICKAIIK